MVRPTSSRSTSEKCRTGRRDCPPPRSRFGSGRWAGFWTGIRPPADSSSSSSPGSSRSAWATGPSTSSGPATPGWSRTRRARATPRGSSETSRSSRPPFRSPDGDADTCGRARARPVPAKELTVPKILFSPHQPDAVLDIARSLTPAGFELAIADPGTPEFYQAATDAEYYLGLARQMGGEFFRSAPKLKLVQLLSAGYDRVDVEAARKAKVPVANNGGANAIAVAEHTILLMLAVLKRLVRLHNCVVAGKWRGGDE